MKSSVLFSCNLSKIRPWAMNLSGSQKSGMGVFSRVVIFFSKIHPPHMQLFFNASFVMSLHTGSGKTRNDGNGNGKGNGNVDGNSLVTLTHSAVVAHSASALKVPVPFEFCCQ